MECVVCGALKPSGDRGGVCNTRGGTVCLRYIVKFKKSNQSTGWILIV